MQLYTAEVSELVTKNVKCVINPTPLNFTYRKLEIGRHLVWMKSQTMILLLVKVCSKNSSCLVNDSITFGACD